MGVIPKASPIQLFYRICNSLILCERLRTFVGKWPYQSFTALVTTRNGGD